MKKILIIFSLIFLFLIDRRGSSWVYAHDINIVPANSVTRTVYLINTYLHTGFVLKCTDVDVERIPAAGIPKAGLYYDIGWGDEDFYQDPDFKLSKAAKALFLPTPSVIRMESFTAPVEEVIRWCDYCVKVEMTDDQFLKLCEFIKNSFKIDKENKLIIDSMNNTGDVIFFKALGSYHLFNTCNTWIALGLEYAGFDISPTGVITAKNLFEKIKVIGAVVKSKY
jgi:hypothetical protein